MPAQEPGATSQTERAALVERLWTQLDEIGDPLDAPSEYYERRTRYAAALAGAPELLVMRAPNLALMLFSESTDFDRCKALAEFAEVLGTQRAHEWLQRSMRDSNETIERHKDG
jgi:hypothetical protein